MPTCVNCQKPFPNRIKIEPEWKVLNSRKFCLECSPYRSHNTSKIARVITDSHKLCSTYPLIELLFKFYIRIKNPQRESRRNEFKTCHYLRAENRFLNQRKAVDYKGVKCCWCGDCKSIAALYFHHLSPKHKYFNISGESVVLDNIIPKLNKCILV